MAEKKAIARVMVNEPKCPLGEAAKRWNVANKTAYAWRAAGRFSYFKMGRAIYVPESEVVRILEESFIPARDAA